MNQATLKPVTQSVWVFCFAALWGLASFASQASAQDIQKTWIFLTDKRDAMGKTTTVEPGYITPRAQERRQIRGSGWSAIRDAPISSVYTEALAAEGIQVVRKSRWLNAVTAYLDAEQRAAVGQLPFVRKLQRVAGLAPDVSVAFPSSPVVAQLGSRTLNCGSSCTQLQVVNAVTPLENDIDGSGVVIGFLDSRFDYTSSDSTVVDEPLGHPSTHHFVSEGRVKYHNYTADDPGVGDQRSPSLHGLRTTSVALGYAAGSLIGPCHDADTVYLAHTEWAPLERNVEEDNFVEAVEWMESSGVDVISVSLSYSTFDAGEKSYSPSDMDGDTGVTTIAFDLAAENGVVPITSAGNTGTSATWSIIQTPADGDSVIAVGAVSSDSSLASWSSRGPTADNRTKPEVTAQGNNVRVALSNGGYGSGTGTSYAAPMVAGIVCQMLQKGPSLTPAQVTSILKQTAHNSGSPNNSRGWGIVNAQAAINKAEEVHTGFSQLPVTPSLFSIEPPYPNPFGEEARFVVTLAEPLGDVRIEVFNAIGQRVITPYAGPLGVGKHTFTISGQGLAAGLYTFLVTGGGTTESGLMVHIR